MNFFSPQSVSADKLRDDSLVADARLWSAVAQGDREAFAALVRRYEAALRRVAASRLGRDDWAEEAVQETFLAALKSAHTYNPQYAFRTWLWTILLNQCRRRARPRGAGLRFVPQQEIGGSDAAEPQCELPTPPAQAMAAERRRVLERLLARLPETEADALRLRFFGGMTFAEIAATETCSLLTAKNRVKRGLMRLAEMQPIRELSGEEPATSSAANDGGPERPGALS